MHTSKRIAALSILVSGLLGSTDVFAQDSDVDTKVFADTPPTKVATASSNQAPAKTTKAAPDSNPWSEGDTYTMDDPSGTVLPYQEGSAIPNGYRLRASPRYGLIAGGIAMTSALWTISTIAAIVLDEEAADEGDPNFDDMYWPMFIPVVGPFVAIKTSDASGTGAAILALDGVVQTAGLAMMIAGLAAPKLEVVPQQKIHVSPRVSAGGMTIEVGGEF